MNIVQLLLSFSFVLLSICLNWRNQPLAGGLSSLWINARMLLLGFWKHQTASLLTVCWIF